MSGYSIHRRRASMGLSLIELMISLTIGLIVVVTIMSAYLGAAEASRTAEAQARMNEDAQAALTILTQQLRAAGNNPKQPNYTDSPYSNPVFGTSTFAIRGCDGPFGSLTHPLDPTTLTCAGSSAAPDAVAVTYEADRYSSVATTTGLATDCLGQSLPVSNATVNVSGVATAKTFTVASGLYYIGTSTAVTAPSLYCRGNGNSVSQPLVENIEDLQLVYGTAPAGATSTLSVAGYLTADGIAADANLAALASDAARWGKVMTVRICIVVRSENQVVKDAASARYTQCDGTVNTSPPDLRMRRPYFTTVVLRNRMSN